MFTRTAGPPPLTYVFEIEPGTLPPHRLAAFFPLMSPSEYEGLVTSIAVSGQECLAVRFQGQLLDGRNRDNACKQLGKNLQIVDFLGTADEAFDHVVNVNRYRRGLTKSQCAAVGVKLMPHISPQSEEDRAEKICAARKLLGQNATKDVALVPHPNLGPAGKVRTRDIAAAIMGVSPTYIQLGLRVQREDPELSLKIWNGRITAGLANPLC